MATKHRQHEANAFETIGSDLGKTLTKEVAGGIGSGIFSELLGVSLGISPKTSEQEPKAKGSVSKGEVLFSKENHTTTKKELIKKSAKAESRTEAAIDYKSEVVKTERISKQEVREMEGRIQQIVEELQKLVRSSQQLQSNFRSVTMEKHPVNAGKYHETFLEWMLITIRSARQKVDDSNAWLSTGKGKHGKKATIDVTKGVAHQAGERTTIQNSAG